MKKANNPIVALIIGSSLFLLVGCTKPKDDLLPEVSDSIYGTYVDANKENRIGDWTDIFSGIIIKVKPAGGNYITIAISGVMNVAYPKIFDSVVLAPNKTFSIDRFVTDSSGFSPTGFFHITGTGYFSSKSMSLNFTTIYRENPLLHSPYKVNNASKTSDKYN